MSNIKVGDEIEITSCLINSYWYKGKVGQKFRVVNEAEMGFAVGDGTYYILKQDCKLVECSLKSILTNGRRVKLRNDTMFTVLDGALIDFKADDCNFQSNNFQGSYKENLTHIRNTDFDIVSIYERPPCVASYFNYCYTTDMLWQREEKTAKQLQLEALQKQAQDVADAIKKLQDEE